MGKETIICIIIIILIFSLDIVTQRYTTKTTLKMSEILTDLKENILNGNKNEIENKIANLDEEWEKSYDKLAYYIEHDELEKVNTSIVMAKSYIQTEDFDSAIAELDVGKFVLEHIQNKYAFELVNLF